MARITLLLVILSMGFILVIGKPLQQSQQSQQQQQQQQPHQVSLFHRPSDKKVIDSGTENRITSTSTGQSLTGQACRAGEYIGRDCMFYMECHQGEWVRKFCPPGKYWNKVSNRCDHLNNVPECYAIYKSMVESYRRIVEQRQARDAKSELSSNEDDDQQEYDETSDMRGDIGKEDDDGAEDNYDQQYQESPQQQQQQPKKIDMTYQNMIKNNDKDRYRVNFDINEDYDDDDDDDNEHQEASESSEEAASNYTAAKTNNTVALLNNVVDEPKETKLLETITKLTRLDNNNNNNSKNINDKETQLKTKTNNNDQTKEPKSVPKPDEYVYETIMTDDFEFKPTASKASRSPIFPTTTTTTITPTIMPMGTPSPSPTLNKVCIFHGTKMECKPLRNYTCPNFFAFTTTEVNVDKVSGGGGENKKKLVESSMMKKEDTIIKSNQVVVTTTTKEYKLMPPHSLPRGGHLLTLNLHTGVAAWQSFYRWVSHCLSLTLMGMKHPH